MCLCSVKFLFIVSQDIDEKSLVAALQILLPVIYVCNTDTTVQTKMFFFLLIFSFNFQESHRSVKKAGIDVQQHEGEFLGI